MIKTQMAQKEFNAISGSHLEPYKLRNKQYHREVLLSGFHLNGHIIEFCPETQKLEPSLNRTPSFTLRVKRLKQHLKKAECFIRFCLLLEHLKEILKSSKCSEKYSLPFPASVMCRASAK